MNFNWKFFVGMSLPFIEAAGRDYIGKDADDAGKDDMIGQTLLYVAALLRALIADKPVMPKPPAIVVG